MEESPEINPYLLSTNSSTEEAEDKHREKPVSLGSKSLGGQKQPHVSTSVNLHAYTSKTKMVTRKYKT